MPERGKFLETLATLTGAFAAGSALVLVVLWAVLQVLGPPSAPDLDGPTFQECVDGCGGLPLAYWSPERCECAQ